MINEVINIFIRRRLFKVHNGLDWPVFLSTQQTSYTMARIFLRRSCSQSYLMVQTRHFKAVMRKLCELKNIQQKTEVCSQRLVNELKLLFTGSNALIIHIYIYFYFLYKNEKMSNFKIILFHVFLIILDNNYYQQSKMLTRRDPANFRQTILCAIIAEQNIILQDINMRRSPPGLKPQQSIFLRLVQSVSNGSKIMVAKGGTHLRFFAGMITNNEGVDFSFDCGLHRSIGYFLQYLILISMFGKNSLTVTLTGITNNNDDNSVDSIQQHLILLLKEHYEFDNQLAIKVLKRGYLPNGGGVVQVTIPTVRKLKKINIEDKGYVKRVRGICAGSLVSTSIMNQVKDGVKAQFLDFLPDVWIYTDFYKGDKASLSPGYSLSLKAETNTSSVISFDSSYEGEKTEEFTKKAVSKFMDEIKYSGVISTNYQWFLLTLMALSERKTSSAKIGRVSPFTVECLRTLRDFFGVTFEIEESKTDGMAIFRCLGIGYENYARVAN